MAMIARYNQPKQSKDVFGASGRAVVRTMCLQKLFKKYVNYVVNQRDDFMSTHNYKKVIIYNEIITIFGQSVNIPAQTIKPEHEETFINIVEQRNQYKIHYDRIDAALSKLLSFSKSITEFIQLLPEPILVRVKETLDPLIKQEQETSKIPSMDLKQHESFKRINPIPYQHIKEFLTFLLILDL